MGAAVVGFLCVTTARIGQGALRGRAAIWIGALTFLSVGHPPTEHFLVILLVGGLSRWLNRPTDRNSHNRDRRSPMTDILTLAWTFVRLSFLCVGEAWVWCQRCSDRSSASTAGSPLGNLWTATPRQVTPGPGHAWCAFIDRVYGLLGAFVAMTGHVLPTSL